MVRKLIPKSKGWKIAVALWVVFAIITASQAGYWKFDIGDFIYWGDNSIFVNHSDKSISVQKIKDVSGDESINLTSNVIQFFKSLTVPEGNLSAHLLNTSNPHQVTPSQIGAIQNNTDPYWFNNQNITAMTCNNIWNAVLLL